MGRSDTYCASSTCDDGDGRAKQIDSAFKRHWCSHECWQDSDRRMKAAQARARIRWADVPPYVEDTEPRGKPIRGEPE